MSKEIEKKSLLGAKVHLEGEHKYDVKKELKKYNLKPVEKIKVTNPITGKSAVVKIERDGTPESKLMMTLANKKYTRDQKDSVLSMYLFERGKESASFLTDLIRYKGQYAKEGQVFKKQMRFDFELFADLFVRFLIDTAEGIRNSQSRHDPRTMLDEVADRFEDTSKTIVKRMRAVTNARMKEKGFGIYIDRNGKPYSIFDEDIEEVVKKDKKTLKDKDQAIS